MKEVKELSERMVASKARKIGAIASRWGLYLLIAAGALFSASAARAGDIYVAQSSAGGNNGADCADARPYTSLTGSDWVAGNTIHLCGTFALPAGANGVISVGGSGTSGNPITVKFETGASASAPYFGTSGFITANNRSYIVIDGGTNGTIQNTANGAALANAQASAGIFFSSVSNSEIKNLTIANIFVASAGNNNNGTDAFGIDWIYGSNVRVDNNTLHDCRWCLSIAYQGGGTTQNWEVDHNTIYNTDHGPTFSSGDTGAVLSGTNSIHDNIIHDFAMFDDPANNAHHDGIHVFAVQSGAKIVDVKIYNNYFYGNPGTHATGYVFTDAESGGTIQAEIFNNLVVESGSTAPALFFLQSDTPAVYNNTFIGSSTSSGGCLFIYGANAIIKNNIFSTCNSAIYVQGGSIAASNNNDFFNLPGGFLIISGGATYNTVAALKSAPGNLDANSISGNPNLNGSYIPNAGSPVIGAGANLTSLGIAALNSDKAGTARPASSAWTIGAYGSGAGTSSVPAPPTNVTATVK